MPTVITHAAVPLAIGLGLGPRIISKRLLFAGVIASILPDADVLLHNPYASPFGHRGFTHSFVIAAAMALLGAALHRQLRSTITRAAAFLFFSGSSHGLLDTLTDGGRGVALLWPFSAARFFAPFRFIHVSPIGVGRFLHSSSLESVVLSEFLYVWIPMIALYFMLRRADRRQSAHR